MLYVVLALLAALFANPCFAGVHRVHIGISYEETPVAASQQLIQLYIPGRFASFKMADLFNIFNLDDGL